MNIRVILGMGLILSLLILLPASAALPEVGCLTTTTKTGTAWITFASTNSTDTTGPVAVSYIIGEVSEIPTQYVSEDMTGMVVITSMEGGVPHEFTLSESPTGGSTYAINSVTVMEGSPALLVNNYSFVAPSSVANYYNDVVPNGKQHEWVDLDWKNPSKDLKLMIYTPDATLGPYSDIADGKKDGRIFLDIASRLNVTAGHWFFRVQNEYPDPANYLLNTYSA
ncbi:hypothetical protein [Methanoregula sp.]|uniref:hypothetical protein n=1 Tax=Methanoregula sp. TaxID=2052170 RepID=UPI00236F027D|nr:hypothetical protein [Methanoregula sp.]MDD1686633.1 hypothetical protein [Methanoregula sp.]